MDLEPSSYQTLKSGLWLSPKPLSMDRYRAQLEEEDVTNPRLAKVAWPISRFNCQY